MDKAQPPYRIEWRPMARENLRSIIRYIGKDSPTRALSFGKQLRDKTLQLCQYPNSGRSGRPGVSGDIRELVAHRNYIVFYRVFEDSRVVEILQVKHAAQQIP